MKLIVVLSAFVSLQSCEKDEVAHTRPGGSIESNLNINLLFDQTDELTFVDTAEGGGIGPNQEFCSFRVFKDGSVIISSYAYDLRAYKGKFSYIEGEIIITIDSRKNYSFSNLPEDPDIIQLPILMLRQTKQGTTLVRKDGRVDFSEHWNVYPPVNERIFPFRLLSHNNKQNKSDMATPRKPSDQF